MEALPKENQKKIKEEFKNSIGLLKQMLKDKILTPQDILTGRILSSPDEEDLRVAGNLFRRAVSQHFALERGKRPIQGDQRLRVVAGYVLGNLELTEDRALKSEPKEASDAQSIA